jgi:hypothetical protein
MPLFVNTTFQNPTVWRPVHRAISSTTFAIHSSLDDFFYTLILLQPPFLLEPSNDALRCFWITRGLTYVTGTAVQTTNSNHIVFQFRDCPYWQNKRRPTFITSAWRLHLNGLTGKWGFAEVMSGDISIYYEARATQPCFYLTPSR